MHIMAVNATKSDNSLLSALTRDIEERVMERILNRFSQYGESLSNINRTLNEATNDLTSLHNSVEKLKSNDRYLQTRINLQQILINNNTKSPIYEQRIFRIEQIIKTVALRSCYDYKRFGLNTSGSYYINPNGRWALEQPFLVNCDLNSGTTEIAHNQLKKVVIPHCSSDFCYHLKIKYPASMTQMKTLIDISQSCTQEIHFECYLSSLYTKKKFLGAWLNRDGKKEFYFVGSNQNHHACSCGLDAGCSGGSATSCNCYNRKAEYQTDAGTITNMSALPITGFKYGSFQFPAQSAAITIGSLKCSGGKNISQRRIYDSCKNIKWYNAGGTGNYIINNGTVVFCNMEKSTDDPKLQTIIGQLNFKDVM